MKTETEIAVELCCNTYELSDVVENLHIIVGPNGKCMCGGPYACEMLTCSEILCRMSEDIRSAKIMATCGGIRINPPTPQNKDVK